MIRRILLALLALALPSLALAQGSARVWDVTDPPVFAITASTYDVTNGVVVRDTGTFVFPTWAASARVLISGTLYTVNTRDSDTQVTLDNLTVNALDQSISVGPDAAFPNDTVDDTAHLQAFFDAGIGWIGGHVVMPGADPRLGIDESSPNEWGYLLSGTLTIDRQAGLHIFGGGVARQVAPTGVSQTAGGAPLKNARLSWAVGAGAVGPMVLIKDCSGIVLEGVNVVGNDGTDQVTPLVRFDNTADASGDLASVNRLSNCSFHQYQIGCQLSSTTGSNSAEFIWDNCFFDGNQEQTTWESVTANPVTQAAVWITSDQQLNFTFQHCEIIDSAIAIYFKKGGSFRWYGGSSSICGDFLRRDDGAQNNSQFSINDLYIDASGNTRQVLLRHGEPNAPSFTGDVWGNVIFNNFRHSSDYPTHADDWVTVSTWPDATTTITLSEPILLAPGDTVSFQDATDPNTTRGPVLATATIVSRTSSTQYQVDTTPDAEGLSALVASGDLRMNENNSPGRTAIGSYSLNTLVLVDDIGIRVGDTIALVDSSDTNNRIATTKVTAINSIGATTSYAVEDTAAELGVDDELNAGTLRALDGTPLFICTGGERLVVRDAFFNESVVSAGRLARINEGTWPGGGAVYALFQNCSLAADIPVDLPNNYLLRRSSDLGTIAVGSTIVAPVGTPFYRFEDCAFYGVTSATPPMGITNIRPYQRVHTAAPTVNDDDAAGYPLFATWFDDTTDTEYVLTDPTTGAAVWSDQTGANLPVDDTQALVRDPADNSKLMRIDVGAVATGQTRVLSLPDSDVTLFKNNVTTTNPTVNDDLDLGYAAGSQWLNTSASQMFVCTSAANGAAVWLDITGSGGVTLPVDDTTAIVRDPADNTKLMRIDVGSVSTGTTRVLSLPDSDVSLFKNNVTSTNPTVNDDSGDGYTVGSRWLNSSAAREYVLTDATLGAAVWTEVTGGSGGGGVTLPVDDTTALVRDPADNTKLLRLDAGTVATGVTRAIIAPDADVTLHKDNLTATVKPTVNDDSTQGYSVGSRWFDTVRNRSYVCLDATAADAIWGISAISIGLPSSTHPFPANRVWVIERKVAGGVASIGTKTNIAKASGETLTVAADFTDILETGVDVATISSITPEGALGVAVSNQVIDGKFIEITFTGGNAGVSGNVTLTIVDDASPANTIVATVPMTITP